MSNKPVVNLQQKLPIRGAVRKTNHLLTNQIQELHSLLNKAV